MELRELTIGGFTQSHTLKLKGELYGQEVLVLKLIQQNPITLDWGMVNART